jgi:hypothetical protein
LEFDVQVIFDCRFLALMAVVGSLAGSILCFLKGSFFVVESFKEYFQAAWQGLGTSQVVFLLVEAVGRLPVAPFSCIYKVIY